MFRPQGERIVSYTGSGRAVAPAGILIGGTLLWWTTTFHAAALPAIFPWDFAWAWYLAFAFSILWYVRGWRSGVRPPGWRLAFLIAGAASIWAVLQTRFEYAAQHMFFLNRAQHVVLHHLGPFLIALAWPWNTLMAGMPEPVRRWACGTTAARILDAVRRPDIACGLFVGLIALWLTPAVHFVAMVDPPLYQVMNWSMVVDGLLFWTVVLDPRPAEDAGNGFPARALMGVGVMLPQVAMGAILAFQTHDVYGFYAWCGRLYPAIDALSDQRIGGMIVWIPPAMMSALSLILVLNNARIVAERAGPAKPVPGGVSSAGWTGR